MAYLMIWQRKKQVYSWRESWIWENRPFKFRTIVSEVSSFVGNPVLSTEKICIHWNWKFLIDMEKAREMHMLEKLHKTKYGEPNYCIVFAPIYT